MKQYNLSPQKMFFEMALEHTPTCKFQASDAEGFVRWKEETLPKVIATLGDFPARVPLNPELVTEWEHNGIVKQRWLLDVGPHISASCYVCHAPDLDMSKKHPAILCWHGHGNFGKDSVFGNDSWSDRKGEIQGSNYNYGEQMAHKGFVTFGIDWMGMGERNDSNKPHYLKTNVDWDWCNMYYLHATMLGMTALSINISHGMAATDFACSLPYVDEDKLGVMGMSTGGTMTLWSALCDERMKAAEIICYCDLWPSFAYRTLDYCGSQVAPGLLKLVDLPDLEGLLAPKPLQIDIGIYDTVFLIDTTMKAYRQVEHIYRTAGAADKLQLDLMPAEHSWGGMKSEAFFRKHLGCG